MKQLKRWLKALAPVLWDSAINLQAHSRENVQMIDDEVVELAGVS